MPVTAKFSEEFYERLGHGVADELVDWFNTVDATYRSDLQGRFTATDVTVEQRFARFAAKFNATFAAFEEKLAVFEARLDRRINEASSQFSDACAGLTADMRAMERRLIGWMFATSAGTIVTWAVLLRLWR